MTKDKEETEKRALHKLLREYDANSGMAGFVCSRPVELMPEVEQDRIFSGFCNLENLRILAGSREKLMLARSLDLNESETKKIDAAIPILDQLGETFAAYLDSKLSREELRTQVRKIRYKPIPESQEDLINSFSHLIETLHFLATQPLDSKDSWDRMVDCVQMHDALTRAKAVCMALQALTTSEEKQVKKRSEAIDKTIALAKESLEFLECFFKEEVKSEELQGRFTSLSEGLKEIWIDSP